MCPVHDPLPAPLADGMVSYNLASVAHDNPAGEDHDLDRFADQTPRNRVAVSVEVNGTVGSDLADQVTQLPKRSTATERTKHVGLIGEANERQFARGPVHAHVGNLAVPLIEMRNEGAPAHKAATSYCITLHISDASLILAFGSRSVWSAGSRREAPIARKGMETGIEPHLPCRRIMMFDQRLGIVDQDLSRNATEPQERPFHSCEPIHLPLSQRGLDVHPARIPQCRHE